MMPGARVYVPLDVAHKWNLTHRGPMSQVALALARQQGNLAEGQNEGYDAAVVRVTDPVHLTEVRAKISELGFGSFSIVDELDQIRIVFLIIDSVLGLLGGISLLVASFGIANTMIMSILERTRRSESESDRRRRSRDQVDLFRRSGGDRFDRRSDWSFAGVGHRRTRESSRLSIHLETAGRVVRRLLLNPAPTCGSAPFCLHCSCP